ncbi:MAG: nucleoside-triphosphatase [Anaerolineaceae bacterium]
MEKYTGRVLLITGERNSGKTLLCKRMIEIARRANWQIKGLLSPAILKGDQKTGIGVEDLYTGKRFMLARLPEEADDGAPVRTEGWVFDERCVAWCNSVLEQATPCDLLVVDEIGPLELVQNSGWTAAIPAVATEKYHLALLVVRDELLATLQERFPEAVVVRVTPADRIDDLVEKIIGTIMSAQGSLGEVN